ETIKGECPQWGEDQDGGVVKERYRRVAATDRTTTTLLEDRWAALCTVTLAFANGMVSDDAAVTGVIDGERADQWQRHRGGAFTHGDRSYVGDFGFRPGAGGGT